MDFELLMDTNRAFCRKCGDIEPQDWDFYKEGLWVCCCKKSFKKHIVDKILKQIEKENK